jgi:hypothetical protein
VARVLLREAFAFEHVAQVPAAVSADYLRAPTIRIRTAFDAARVFFIEAWPTAARLEFGFRREKRVIATPAYKRARRIQRLVLAGERSFCSFVDDDSLFLR